MGLSPANARSVHPQPPRRRRCPRATMLAWAALPPLLMMLTAPLAGQDAAPPMDPPTGAATDPSGAQPSAPARWRLERPAAAGSTISDRPLTPEERLAGRYARIARLVVQRGETLTSGGVQTASGLIERAMALDPTATEYRRLAIDIALLSDREDLYEKALNELAALDPADDTVRLRQINLLLERFNTVGERIRAIDRIMSGEAGATLSGPLRSRLALSKALMLRRHGDLEGFADALAEAVEADPFHPSAVAIAAGFFSKNVDDPAAEAELLSTVLLADPTDTTAQVAFGQLALENAAYPAAARLYDLAVSNRVVLRQPSHAPLLADLAIARWGAGRPDDALAVIRSAQDAADDALRTLYWQYMPQMDPDERGVLRAPIEPTLATIRAAILFDRDDPRAEQALADLVTSYETVIDPELPDFGPEFEEQFVAPPPPPDERIARMKLQLAWSLLWLGGSIEEARTVLEEAHALEPLVDSARARFEGFIALRRNDPAAAVERLEPLAEGDPLARFGLARAYADQGRSRDAARTLLSVAREMPGSVIGIMASSELAELLGRTLPISDTARAINRVVADIPSAYFEYPGGSNRAVGIRLHVPRTTVGAMQPIWLEVQVTNHSPFPLAIDEDGPIRPEVVLQFDSRILLQSGQRTQLPPVVVDIGQRLRLEPHETLTIPINLSHYQIGKLIDEGPLPGTFVTVAAWINPAISARGKLQRGLLSGQDESSPIRVNGARLNAEWLDETMALFTQPEIDDRVLTRMALVAHIIGFQPGPETETETIRIIESLRNAFSETFLRLDEASAAWVLSQVPRDALPREIRNVVQQTTSRDILLVYLLTNTESINDPILEYAMRQGDPLIRRVANQVRAAFQQAAAQERERREEGSFRSGSPPSR